MFTVNANLFRLAALVVSSEETRYYLQGVCIEKHPHLPGAILTATDGHRLVTIHDTDAQVVALAGPVIVRLGKAALTACKPVKRETGERLVAFDDGKLPAEVRDAEGRAVALQHDWHIDGTFPDWRRVMPRTLTPAVHGFNAAYLSTIAAIGAGIGFPNMTVETAEGEGPALIRFVGAPHVVALLMPVRHDESQHGLPAWLRTTEAEAEAGPDTPTTDQAHAA